MIFPFKVISIPAFTISPLFVVSEDENIRNIFENNKEVYVNLAFTSEITVAADKAGIGEDAVSVVIPGAVCYLPLEDLVDFEKEKERLNKLMEVGKEWFCLSDSASGGGSVDL